MSSARDANGVEARSPRRESGRRLLVVTPWWPAFGDDPFGSFVRDQAIALEAAGADVRVAVVRLSRPGAPGEEALSLGRGVGRVRIHRAPWLPHRAGYDLLLREWTGLVRRAVRAEGRWARGAIVVVHTQDLAVPAARALGRTGLPWVVVAHGAEPESPRLDRVHRIREYRKAMAKAARVIAVGPGLARLVRGEAPDADVRTVANGYDRALVERILSEPPAGSVPEPRIVSVSNLVEGKGVHLTIEALAARARSGLPVPRYDVVGDGAEREALEALVAREGIGERVKFFGALSHDGALRVVRGATAFVLPSAPEALGIAYLEAMALGVPPVAIEGEGPSAFVEDGKTGLLVTRTVEAVGAAIERVLTAPGLAERLGRAAGKACRALDWDASARRFLAELPEARVENGPRGGGRPPLWLSLYNEPTPYVTAKQDAMEATGRVRLRRAWAGVGSSQAWGADARFREEDVLDGAGRVAGAAWDLVRGRYAGLHAGGWGGARATPVLFAAAWAGRRPLVIESDTHVSRSEGWRAAARRAYLRWLDRRVLAWMPGGTPQAEHLRAAFSPRARVVVEGMTTDTETLSAEAARVGPGAAAAFRARHGIGAAARLILYVGRLAPEKGIGDLVEAVARLAAEGMDVVLALVGPGELDGASRARLSAERLRVVGRVPWRDLVPAYLAADVFALPSRFEPWGLVVNEALLMGCPVVVTDAVGAARDLVSGTGAGVVVPAGDSGALAAGLRRVIEAGGRESEFARRGREVAAEWTSAHAASAVVQSMIGDGVAWC